MAGDRVVDIGAVRVFDHGELCDDSKATAMKVLEEAAEAEEAWKEYDRLSEEFEGSGLSRGNDAASDMLRNLADELGDVVQAVSNLAYECGIDMAIAMARCEARNRERGRIS